MDINEFCPGWLWILFVLFVWGIPIVNRFLVPTWRKIARQRAYKKAVRHLRERGKQTQATIQDVTPGERVHRAPRPVWIIRHKGALTPPEPALYDEYYNPDDGKEWQVTLKVRMSYLSEIEIKKKFILSRAQYMQLVPGKTIDVVLDLFDPQSVEIVWSQK